MGGFSFTHLDGRSSPGALSMAWMESAKRASMLKRSMSECTSTNRCERA